MGSTNNIALEKSFNFALKVIETCRSIQKNKKEFILSKQFLRSGTSIGANLHEAVGGQSKKDFLAKVFISYKEARESMYWLKLFSASGLLEKDDFKILSEELEEILKILGATIRTVRK
jgi:four helix bundle protein